MFKRLHTMILGITDDGEGEVVQDKNGREIDPIIAFAKTQHLYAEGPDFLLSDAILYPYYYLIMSKFPKQTMKKLLPKTMLWYDRVSLISNQSCEEIIGRKITLDGLKIRDTIPVTRCWPSKTPPDQSLYKNDPNRLNPKARIFTRQPDIDRAMTLVEDAKIKVHMKYCSFQSIARRRTPT